MWTDYRTRKLHDHASAQCCVRLYKNGDICLQSYMTDVVYYDSTRGFLYCTGTYSQTTRKHISWFLREYFPSVSYQSMRDCYQNDEKYHVGINVTRKLDQREQNVMYSAHHGATLYPDNF